MKCAKRDNYRVEKKNWKKSTHSKVFHFFFVDFFACEKVLLPVKMNSIESKERDALTDNETAAARIWLNITNYTADDVPRNWNKH